MTMKTVMHKPGKRPVGKRVRTPGIQPGETAVTIQGHQAPRLPNERDESASSQEGGSPEVIQQAARDVKSGMVDSDRGTPMDDTYAREFRSEHDHAGVGSAKAATHKAGREPGDGARHGGGKP